MLSSLEMHSPEGYLPEAVIAETLYLSSSPSRGPLATMPLENPLSAIGQFHLMVDQVPRSTIEEDQELAARARAGDKQAREVLILRTLPYIRQVARTQAGRLAHDDFLDLVSEAVLVVTEKLDYALIKSDKPIYYLLSVAKFHLRTYCEKHRSLVTSPARESMRDRVYWTESLDVPLGEEDSLTLADMLSAPDLVLSARAEPEYTQVYQAIEKLTGEQQEVIARHYGIGERAPERLAEIGRTSTGGNVYKIRDQALTRLRKLMVPKEAPSPKEARPKKQKAETEEALSLAYQELMAEGVRIGMSTLMARSGRGRKACRTWLEQHHPERLTTEEMRKDERAGKRHEKLEAAYQELVARGVPITGTRLAEATHMRKEYAFAWMEAQGLRVKPDHPGSMEPQEAMPPAARESRTEEVVSTPEKLLSSVFPKGLPGDTSMLKVQSPERLQEAAAW